MAVDKSSTEIRKEVMEETVLKIKLLVDKEKNKVVLAEVGKDFVDVLFTFLALPMGTIVRLLEKYQQDQKSQTTKIGCFNNLYKSVGNMGTDDFLTEACKHALLNTRSVKEKQCRQLKINIDNNEVVKYYRCSKSSVNEIGISHTFSNFCSLRCSCGSLMNVEFGGTEENINDELFVSKYESFILTDNMEVASTSISLVLKTIKGLGYADVDQLQEILVDVNHEKVLALLECLLSSDNPLTNVFLRNRSSYVMTRARNIPSLAMQDEFNEKSNKEFSVTVFVRKQDGKVLYVESKEDFVDLLFSFLAVPLEYAWEFSGSSLVLGCIGNLCKSIKRYDEAPYRTLNKRILVHWHYSVPQQLLDVRYVENFRETAFSKCLLNQRLLPMHPNGSLVLNNQCSRGFVKGGKTYMISDDLTITPITSSTFSMVKKLETDLNDIEMHVIKISKDEAVRLLRASLMTSNALNTALGCLIPKKLKEEKL